MKFLLKQTSPTAKVALLLGILSGFGVLALTIIFLFNDVESAEVMIWVAIGCSLLPAFLVNDDARNNRTCKNSNP